MVYYDFLGSNYFTVCLKYLLQTITSLIILLRERPDVVFVMSPPIIACLPVYLYCWFWGKQFIIDAHTATFLHPRWKDKKRLNSFFIRRTLRTIVTNEYLGQKVESWGGKYFLLSDVPIEFHDSESNVVKNKKNKPIITMVNTFAPDEPLENFIAAASRFEDVDFYITGKITNSYKNLVENTKRNSRFTDFLSNQDYAGLLRKSDVICAFTTRDHTMLRGAYEAIYLGKPVIISNWKLLREKFPIGAIHVDNTIDGIAGGIRQALNNIDALTAGAILLRDRKMSEWSTVKMDLENRMVNKKYEGVFDY